MEEQIVSQAVGPVFGLTPTVSFWLWTMMIIYILIMLGIGWFSGRKIEGLSDFLVAGRRLPLWMATATLLATWFGAGSSMGVAASVYSDGIGSVIADPFAASISLILAGFFVVGYLRKINCLTVTDIIERKYGRTAGIYASVWMLPVYIGWLGAQMMGLGTIFQVLTGIDKMTGTMIGAVVVLFYTIAGGMWAVTLTDMVQVSLIVLGLFCVLPGAISEAGGWSQMLANIPAEQLSLAKTADASWTYYIGSWIIMGLGCMVGQDLVQRSLASRNEKIAQYSSVIAGVLYMGIAIVPITIGFAARFVLPKYGITDATMGGDLENQVLPRMAVLILGNLSPALMIIFLCALVSAIMSSADSSLLAGSSLLTNNVIRPLWPHLSNRNILLCTRIGTVVLTIIAMLLAIKVESIYALMINSWASQLVIIFFPVITAIYFPKAHPARTWSCMIASTIVWIGYLVVGALNIGAADGFTALMESAEFDVVLTCGSVWGFLAGVAAFFVSRIFFPDPKVCRSAELPEDLAAADQAPSQNA